MINNWGVTVYDEDDHVIAYWEILGRTEGEAEREAESDIRREIANCADWTLGQLTPAILEG